MTLHQSMGHKGPILRPRCIGTERAQTQLLPYSTLGFSVVIFVSSIPMAQYQFNIDLHPTHM